MTTKRRCTVCDTFLASDNTGDVCSPCWRASLRRRGNRVLAIARDRARIRGAFAEGGLRRLAITARCSLAEALEVALAFGLVPAAYRRRHELLARLVELDDLTHVAAAQALGLSRWTVATYRRDLGLGADAEEARAA